jgi:hypothetical protein
MTVSQLLVNFVITQRRCRTSKLQKLSISLEERDIWLYTDV